MESADFSEGVKNLERLLAEGKVIIFCAEKLPWRCHRRYIGRHMEEEKGFQVAHIIDIGKTWVAQEKNVSSQGLLRLFE